MGHRIDELPVITTPSDSDKVVVEHDNLTSQITLSRLIAAERNRLDQLESALQTIGASNGTFYHHFGQDSLLINQVDALEYSTVSTVFGDISSYGHMDATGVPENSSFYVEVRIAAAGYKIIELAQVGNGDRRWSRSKNGGTWGDWVQLPTRTELTNRSVTVNAGSSSVTVNRSNSYRYGNIVFVGVRFTVTSDIAIYGYVLQLPSTMITPTDVYAPLMSSYFTTMDGKGLYMDANTYTFRASSAIPSGNYTFYCPVLVS